MGIIRETKLFVGGAVISLLAGAVILNYLVMPAFVRHGDVHRVPDVVRLPPEEAEERLEAKGFGLKVAGTRYDPEVPEGRVVSQSPKAGSLAKTGRRIYAITSRGGQLYTVPDVQGVSLRQAELLLGNEGLKPGRVTYQASEEVPKDVVVSQNPEQGTSVRAGTLVNLVVSSGLAESTTPDDPSAGRQDRPAEEGD